VLTPSANEKPAIRKRRHNADCRVASAQNLWFGRRVSPPRNARALTTSAYWIARRLRMRGGNSMNTIYRLVLDNGARMTLWAPSAGAAIETARRPKQGRTVTECYAGQTGAPGHIFGAALAPGMIRFEIPPHAPYIPARATLPATVQRGLFDASSNDAIQRESENALRAAQVGLYQFFHRQLRQWETTKQ